MQRVAKQRVAVPRVLAAMGLAGVALLAGLAGCTVDVPTSAGQYLCAAPPCGPALQPCNDASTCPGGETCQVAACTQGVCRLEPAPKGTSCDDGEPCTAQDRCVEGACVGGPAPSCDDDNPCTTDSCTEGAGCSHKAADVPCDDGDACTVGDKCVASKCASGAKADCDDGEPCTTDSCNVANGCVHSNSTAACEDGDACTKGDKCGGGACQPGPTDKCDDGQACTKDTCNAATGCLHTPEDAACDDGKGCTQGSCDAAKGCSFAAITGACDDGDACTEGETCATGSCTGGKPKSCDDGNGCTDDSCSASAGCQHTPNTLPCDDGEACTSADSCAGGTCKGKPSATIACCATLGGKATGGTCSRTSAAGVQELVPEGAVWLGCNATKDGDCSANEKPQHLVQLSGFWLDHTEVTAAAWGACVSAGKCAAPSSKYPTCTGNAAGKGQHPLNCVTWDAARTYCQWAGGDLPTEAQWEKAARGGCEVNGGAAQCQGGMRTWPWGAGKATCTEAVMLASGGSGCGTSATMAVGSKPKGAGPYGHLDLVGSVLEWVRDGWDPAWYSAHPTQAWPADPVQTKVTTERVLKGGSWSTSGKAMRPSHRHHFGPANDFAYLGFRCAYAVD